MKKCIIPVIMGLLLIGVITSYVLASDISGARYSGAVRISNNDTTNSSICCVFDLNTQAMIDSGFMEDGSDASLLSSSGGDLPFMPSLGDSYPWVVFVPSIATNANLDYELYTGNSSGGELRYFPSPAGMYIEDDIDLEISTNGSIEINALLETSGTGLISGSWVSPTGHVDPATKWAQETQAYDNNIGTYAYTSLSDNSWSQNLVLTLSENTTIRQFRTYTDSAAASAIDQLRLYVYTGGGWQLAATVANTDSAYQTNMIPPVYTDKVGISLHDNNNGTGGNAYLYELHIMSADMNIVLSKPGAITITSERSEVTANITGIGEISASGINCGDYYKVEVIANSVNWSLEINDIQRDAMAVGAGLTNNSSNWTIGGSGTLYMGEDIVKIYKAGVLKSQIRWEYGATFTDLSGNGNDATPTFRSVQSDPDISATLLNFSPISEAQVTAALLAYEGEIVEDIPSQPDTMYTDNSSAAPGIFLAPLINEYLDAGNIPRSLFWYPFAYTVIILAGAVTYRITQSLLIQAIIMGALLIFFCLPGLNILGLWTFIFFGFEAFGVIIMAKHFAW